MYAADNMKVFQTLEKQKKNSIIFNNIKMQPHSRKTFYL